MGSNKKRLYVAVFPSGILDDVERQYHWGFLVGPKVEKNHAVAGSLYYVRHDPSKRDIVWMYESKTIVDVQKVPSMLARFTIAKIEDEDCLTSILRSIPVVNDDPDWSSRTWLVNAVNALARDPIAVGTAYLDPESIISIAKKYISEKKASGWYDDPGRLDLPSGPTFDILKRRELMG